ncbi:MAG: glutaredoxin 3 [Gammaproteobacteria bacterium]|jgi:glutaredoxin 3
MPKVIMYTTRFCPYCVRARMLLEKKGVEFTDIRVDSEPQYREEMLSRAAGRTSVPQIFIDEEHIGGCDDLYELDFEGVLDKKLGLE